MSRGRTILKIGFKNYVVGERVVAIIQASSSAAKRLREEAKKNEMLIDATQGQKTRCLIVVDSNHIVLSAIQAETLATRLKNYKPPKQTVICCNISGNFL